MIDPDARLMLRVREGDKAAFERLFRRYTPPLIAFLARMLGDVGRAEELTQEVFVRIHQARERYEPRARFSTWLFGIARRLALNELDRAHHKRERPLTELGGAPAVASGDDPPDDLLQAARTGARLERALAGLPERQRSALLLRVEQDMGYEEIAAVLDTSISSVKSLLSRARATLLDALKEAP